MNPQTLTESLPEELAHRSNEGLDVWLLWRRMDDRVSVVVHDSTTDSWFELEVDRSAALDAFEHPFAYAAARGIAYFVPEA
jgi:hypothetical protein